MAQAENSDELQFEEGHNRMILHLPEVKMILENIISERRQQVAPQLQKTFDYASRFASYRADAYQTKEGQTSSLVRGIIDSREGLHDFERMQLANLCPQSVEEARSLIPSLTDDKIDEHELQTLLDELMNNRNFNQ